MTWQNHLPTVRGKLLRDEPLGPFTWFRVGGKADVLFLPADPDDLSEFLSQLPMDVPICVLGVGSNVIIRDGGVEGVVIRLAGKAFAEVIVDEDQVIADAGALDSAVAKAAAKAGLAGLEFYAGIPGTIGGALTMNAGCYGREITARREASQPIREKTGGSTFKNPEGQSSWKLVDEAGWRGKPFGGAMFSDQHANFIINTGEASASDIEGLGEAVRADVLAKTCVQLDWEIKRIGRI